MIPISGILGGATLFTTSGEFLHVAGPAGFLAAIAIVGVTAVSVLEGMSEMIVLFPISNAMVEFVNAFVDSEMATVVGVTYWYTYASVFSNMVVAAAQLSDLGPEGQLWVFYVGCPIFMLIINWLGVQYYGWIEGIFGIVKLAFVFGAAIAMFVTAGHVSPSPLEVGTKHDVSASKTFAGALCIIIPLLAYGFVGLEIVTVTAFEARSPKASLRFPSKYISYLILFIFVLCGLGEVLNLSFINHNLPNLPGTPKLLSRGLAVATGDGQPTLVLIFQAYGITNLTDFIHGFLIFMSLSAANTALYVSSRTLYGMTRELDEYGQWPQRWLAKLGTTDARTQVPGWALVVSTLSFCWLPALHTSYSSLFESLTTIGTIGALVVWTSQCLAFIRYHAWFRMNRAHLGELNPVYYRWTFSDKSRYMSVLSQLQPFPAYLGLFSCLTIVLVLTSATCWNGNAIGRNLATAYSGPLLMLVFWISLKLIKKRPLFSPFGKIGTDFGSLRTVIIRLEHKMEIAEEQSHGVVTEVEPETSEVGGTQILRPAAVHNVHLERFHEEV